MKINTFVVRKNPEHSPVLMKVTDVYTPTGCHPICRVSIDDLFIGEITSTELREARNDEIEAQQRIDEDEFGEFVR